MLTIHHYVCCEESFFVLLYKNVDLVYYFQVKSMSYVSDYIQEYGKYSFSDKPFCDADNVAMCYMYYMPFEDVVSSSLDDEPVGFDVACNKLFRLRGSEHKPVGLILLKDISVQMMAMANQIRYAIMKIVGCSKVFGQEPAVQFNAATFLLDDGTIVVLFRGTDDSLIGWKEDFDILFKDDVPSNKLACEYLEKVAEKFSGDIIVCGHSKGGYVAQYGALYCKKEVRDRIKCLYNNDGQGFKDYSFLSTPAYAQMLPKYKHFVPESSFIGMMLCHDDDYTVVKSKRLLGPLQHDLSTWEFEGDKLVTADELSNQGKVNDLALYDLVSNLSDEEGEAFDSVLTTAINEGEPNGLLDFKGNTVSAIKQSKTACEKLDEGKIKQFKNVILGIGKKFTNAMHSVKHGNFLTVKQRIDKD
jgi:hypothetical protein